MESKMYAVVLGSVVEGAFELIETKAFTDKKKAQKYLNELYEKAFDYYKEDLLEDFQDELNDAEDEEEKQDILADIEDDFNDIKAKKTICKNNDRYIIYHNEDSTEYCKVTELEMA